MRFDKIGLVLLIVIICYSCQRVIYKDNFSQLNKDWTIESEIPDSTSVFTSGNTLYLDAKAGLTLWLNKLLGGDLVIEYDRVVTLKEGYFRRLSDFNQFWSATDPRQSNLFTRNGSFSSYDDLSLYYMGFGGNTNKTTRFRKYQAGQRILLTEYMDAAHLLMPEKSYHVITAVVGNRTVVYINGELYFDYVDPNPLKRGYFGFRSTWSSQRINNFKIYKPTKEFLKKYIQ